MGKHGSSHGCIPNLGPQIWDQFLVFPPNKFKSLKVNCSSALQLAPATPCHFWQQKSDARKTFNQRSLPRQRWCPSFLGRQQPAQRGFVRFPAQPASSCELYPEEEGDLTKGQINKRDMESNWDTTVFLLFYLLFYLLCLTHLLFSIWVPYYLLHKFGVTPSHRLFMGEVHSNSQTKRGPFLKLCPFGTQITWAR